MNLSAIPYQSLPGKLLRLPLKLIPAESQLPILQGKLRGKRWIVGSSTHGCWLGSYEYEKQRLFEQLVVPGSIVFDVGAHVGFYTLLAATLVGPTGHVWAFEPVPRNLLYLKEHLRLNHITNATVVATAIADYCGVSYFDERSGSSTGHLAPQGRLRVPIATLDHLLTEGQMSMPTYIKIDVEGSELLVLTGAKTILATAHPTLFLATHGQTVHQQCCNLLSTLGYQLTALDSERVETASEILARYPER